MTQISESELIVPTLYILSTKGDVTTSELIISLRELLNPSGEDLAILSGRNDDKFSQKVRNLKAHNTLLRHGVAKEVNTGNNQTIFTITDKGRKLYFENIDNLQTLFSFPLKTTRTIFSEIANEKKITVLSDNPTIFEGGINKKITQKVRSRSARLRNAAIEYYAINEHISCLACSFEFRRFYGDIGKNYIEIHHIVPICEYDEEMELDINTAIKNVVPLCANCHRVVHLHNPVLLVDNIKDAIFQNRKPSI